MTLSRKAMARETALQEVLEASGDRYGIVEHYSGKLSDGGLLIIWGCQLAKAGNVVTVGVCRPDTKGAHFDHPPLALRASDLPKLVELTAGAMVTLAEERKSAVADLGSDGDLGAGALRDRDGRHWLALVRHHGEEACAVLAADAPTLHRALVAAADAVAGATELGRVRRQGTRAN